MKRIAVLFFASFALIGTMYAHAAEDDGSHWEPAGKNQWLSWYGPKEGEAVMQLDRRGDALHFTMRAACKKEGRTFQIAWRHGDEFAHGTDCNGKRATFPTEIFETWVNPLPKELRSPPPTKNYKKREIIVSLQ